MASELFEVTWKARRAAINQSLATNELPPGTYQAHRELLDAIVARDVERARKIIVAHYWNFEHRYRQVLEMETEEHAGKPDREKKDSSELFDGLEPNSGHQP
jgi:DNA-binding FadR family transcriptional regulator